MKVKIKICCISSLEEAQRALNYGVDALGLVSAMPSGPGVIPEETIKNIISDIPSDSNTFLLTSKQDISSIIEQYEALRPTTIQLVDELKNGTLQDLKAALPEVQLVQVVHVLDESSIDYALQRSIFADALLLDSGNPNLSIKTLGGTGNTHDWALSRRIVEAISKPVWLAGGLRKYNVQEAIAQVQPYGIDLCSGVRTEGKLDTLKLRDFIKTVNDYS